VCIIIYKETNEIIPEKTLKTAWEANPHGAGFSYYAHKRGWISQKGYMTFEHFYRDYLPHAKKELVIHFRIATHGVINPENCHPFTDTESSNSVLYHNGILSNFGSTSLSDTSDFYHSCLKHLTDFNAKINLLESLADLGNKFALLEPNGDIQLIGDFKSYKNLFVSNLSLVAFDHTSWMTSESDKLDEYGDPTDAYYDQAYWEADDKTTQAKIKRILKDTGEI